MRMSAAKKPTSKRVASASSMANEPEPVDEQQESGDQGEEDAEMELGAGEDRKLGGGPNARRIRVAAARIFPRPFQKCHDAVEHDRVEEESRDDVVDLQPHLEEGGQERPQRSGG